MARFVLATLLVLPAFAVDVPTDATIESASKLIEKLGDAKFEVREAASQAILERGPVVLPELRKSLGIGDGEVRRRAEGLIAKLEKAAALEPKRITLRVNRRTVGEVLDEITKQTGYVFELQPDPARDKLLYNFEFEKLTFWEAMDRVTETCHVSLHSDDAHTLQVHHATHDSPYQFQNGIVRLAAQGFQHQRAIDFSQVARQGVDALARSESLTFSFSVSTEPKTPLLGLGEVKLVSAYDDQNRSMLPATEPIADGIDFAWGNPLRRFFFAPMLHDEAPQSSGKTHTLTSQVNLARPAHSQKLKSIKGTVLATILIDQRPDLVIADPLKAKGKKFSSGKVTLEIGESHGNTKAEPNYRIKINVMDENAKLGHHHYHWINTLHERFELIDDKGRKFASQHAGWENVEPSRAQVELMFMPRGSEKLGKPVKLVFNKWVTMQYPVEFEFKDLPLP